MSPGGIPIPSGLADLEGVGREKVFSHKCA